MEWTKGKHLLITGASDGIGKSLALAAKNSLSMLSLVATNRTGKLDELRSELLSYRSHVNTFQADVRNINEMERIIDTCYDLQPIDAFIHCAGGSHLYAPFHETSYEDMDRIVDVNFKSTLYWLRYLLPKMIENNLVGQKRAHIIFLSSRSGERALSNLCPYAASKGAIEKLAEGLRTEYAKHKIVFTLVNPGSVYTSFVSEWSNHDAQNKHNSESMAASDIANIIMSCLNSNHAVNKISIESTDQWLHEPGVQL